MKHIFRALLIHTFLFCLFQPIDAQWIRQYPLAKLEHVVDIAIHTDGHGYAVGDDDLILRMDPGTKEWDLLTSWDSGWSLESVDYLENTAGAFVAAGGEGLIISDDAGGSWTEIAGSPEGIHVIHMISASDILVIADGGVFRWANNVWTDLNLPVAADVENGFILDAQHIWCFTTNANSTMYSTLNGGGNWNISTQVERPDVVAFYSAQYGIALDGRTVFQSVDGGMQWTEVSTNAIHNSVNDITFGTSANVLMAATLNGVPTISVDSGATWTQKDLDLINQRNYSIASASDQEFWVGNDLSSITFTSDAGDTWLEKSGPDRKIMNDVFFFNRNFGFAVGTDGTFLRTTNGGATWEDISFGETRSFLSIHGLSTNDVWMGANQRIYHSADMGDTWQEKNSILGANFIDILAVDANIVLACATSGIILRTQDAGISWDTVFQTNNQVRSLAKIDANRFMATGFNGLILRSENQGLTWNSTTVPEAGLQYEQTHFIGQEGWLVTSSFKKTMWHTTNAGDSWEAITLPIDRFWDGVYFITPDTGFVVSRSTNEGRVYTTYNGGANWQPGYITDFPLYGVTGLPNPNGSAWIFGYGSDIEILPFCNMLPVIADFTGEASPCENDTVTYSITSEDVDLFFWLFPTGWQIVGNPNNDTVQVKVGRNGGAISVTGSNACGFSSPISITSSPTLLPKINNLTGDNSPCEGEIITYSAIQSDVVDFVWTVPGDWTIEGNPNQSSIMAQVGAISGMISVVGANQCGETTPFNRNVTPALLPIMHFITGPVILCTGDTVEYVGLGEFYDEVVWTYPADWESIGPVNEIAIALKIGTLAGSVTAAGVNPCGTSPIAASQAMPIDVPDATVIVNDNILTLSHIGVAYQWFLNGVAISGATGPQHTATITGDYYAVIVFDPGCISVTPQVNVVITSVANNNRVLALSVYPTPVDDILHIKGVEHAFIYSIADVSGSVISHSTSDENVISVAHLSEGVYILRLQQEANWYVARFVVMRY